MRLFLKSVLILWAIFCNFPIDLRGQDSLIYYNEVSFSSEFEKKAFDEYFRNGTVDYLSLFLGLSPEITEEDLQIFSNRINQTSQDIARAIEKQKSRKNKVALLYKKIHGTFLTKYEAIIDFNSIFSSGYYNCVTASALYGIFLEQFNLPYTVKEEPSHVYIMVYPQEERILIETTTPIRGYFVFDKAFKDQTIQYLAKQKIISGQEIARSTTDELFDKYYFKNENIDLIKLVGIHYMNNSLFSYDKGDIEHALTQAEKAYLYYPSDRHAYLMLYFQAQLLNATEYKTLETAKLLSRLSRYKNYGIEPSMIEADFLRLTQQTLNQNKIILYDECFEVLQINIKDDDILDRIKYIYFYEKGRLLYNQGRHDEASKFIENSLELQPGNVDLMSFFINNLKLTLVYWDAKDVIEKLESYYLKFDQLSQNNHFIQMLAESYLIQMSNDYDKQKINEGEIYRKKFEDLVNKSKTTVRVSPEAVAIGYSAASVYYFKKNQTTKAKFYIDKGLEFSPNNQELLFRKRMISQ